MPSDALHLQSSPNSSQIHLPNTHSLPTSCLFFFNSASSPVYVAHILLGIGPSIRVWSTYQGPHP